MRRISVLGLGAVAVLVTAGGAFADFVNGSFETGDFTGWVTQDNPAPFYPLTVATLGSDNSFGWPWSSTPTDGDFVAYHGWDGVEAGTIRIAQDVLIDGNTLEFDYRAAWNLTFGATLPREFRVNIEPAGGGGTLQSTLILSAGPDEIVDDTGALSGSVDMSAFVGQTVRVSFDYSVPEIQTGPAAMQLDNVRLIPAPGVLALLGLAGVLGRRRRRND